MKKDIISVVVPVYNVEKYIIECVNSIIKQTYSNIEILLIDDGSTDSSGIICDNFKIKDERIKVFHKANEGLGYTRNFGIEHANGKYIVFIDSDDFISENFIELLYNSIKLNDVEIAYCGHNKYYDKNHIYKGSEAIDSSLSEKIKDPKTFEFLPNGIIYATLYGKDKYNVYYIKNKMLNCFDSSYFIYEVKRINKDKVEVLNDWFIKDDKNIYFKGKILEGVDYNTFKVLPNGDGKDKNRSYEYLTKDEWKWF